MARYRKVDPRIWNDAKFRGLSDNAKLVFFMLLTHPSMTALGAMRGTVAGLSAEMGWKAEAFGEAFGEVIGKGMAEHDPKACFVGLPNFIRYNEPESPNVVKAWVGALDLLPECEQRTRAVSRAVAFAKAKGKAFAEALPKAFTKGWPKTMPYQEQEQEQEQEPEPEQQKGGVPPAHPSAPAPVASRADGTGSPQSGRPQADDGTTAAYQPIRKGKTVGIGRVDAPQRPADVAEQTWKDWLSLRAAKKARVSTTTVDAARKEAAKAGMNFEEFLREWCLRGSQGMKAEWLETSTVRHRTGMSDAQRASTVAANAEQAKRMLFGDAHEVFDTALIGGGHAAG